MKTQNRYSIGDMSQICNISKKALRYYDKIGLISTKRHDANNYRYYTHESLLAVPVIKYYKQMGFKLEEMREFIEGSTPNVYRKIQKSFLQKITELQKEQEETHRKYVSVRDWYDLILEAEMVQENNINEVSVKYMEPAEYLYQEQDFENDIKGKVINIAWTNYVESLNNEITGPVILNFSSVQDRVAEKAQKIRILQKTLRPCPAELLLKVGGCVMASCYHIGSHETINETYKKISMWCKQHGYQQEEEAFERYVTDYWTTRNSAQFVTEIMVKVHRKGHGEVTRPELKAELDT